VGAGFHTGAGERSLSPIWKSATTCGYIFI